MRKVCAEQTKQMADSCFGLVGPHKGHDKQFLKGEAESLEQDYTGI